MMLQGLWLCPRVNMNRLVKAINAPNSEYAARGCPTQATNGCGTWNAYRARTEKPKGAKIDVRCTRCDRRVKFQWIRKDERGRPRPVRVIDMTGADWEEIVNRMTVLNSGQSEIDSTHLLHTGFTSRGLGGPKDENCN